MAIGTIKINEIWLMGIQDSWHGERRGRMLIKCGNQPFRTPRRHFDIIVDEYDTVTYRVIDPDIPRNTRPTVVIERDHSHLGKPAFDQLETSILRGVIDHKDLGEIIL
jgi:hypothetical protein